MPAKGQTPALIECDRALTGYANPYPYGTTKAYILARRKDGLSIRQIHEDLSRDIAALNTGRQPKPEPPAEVTITLWARAWEGNPIVRKKYPKKENAADVG